MIWATHEVLLPGESEQELTELANDVLGRISGLDPSPLDEFTAWEITKELWRCRRQGIDAPEYRRIQRMGTREEQRSADWSEADHRARVRKQAEQTIRTLARIHETVGGRKVGHVELELVEGGRR